MKMMYGNVPVKSLNIHHFEMDTNDCDMVASDLQAGKTAVARGQKITGTGKCFEFAMYGAMQTNFPTPIPTGINIIEISCLDHPVQLLLPLGEMKNTNFSTSQLIGKIIVDGNEYDITASAEYNLLTITCPQTVWLEVFYGKDNYV